MSKCTIQFAIFILVLVLAIFLQTIPVSSYKSKCDKKRCRKQCFSEQDYCWCHNSDGQLVRSMKLSNCHNSKLSPFRKNGSSPEKCVREKWEKFNANFLAMLRNERKHKSKVQSSSNKNETLSWKFQDLDVNKNVYLEKVEYEKWRSLVKKVLKPKSCARNLLRNADQNKDKLLSLNEWLDYFTFLDPREKLKVTKSSGDKNVTISTAVSASTSRILSVGDSVDSSFEDTNGEKSSRCEQERKKVLSVNRTDIYVPQCSSSGLYEKQQCYHTASYCWCVDQVTGKIFPKTTVHNQIANCDEETIAEANKQEDLQNCSSKEFVKTMYMKIPNFSLKNPEKTSLQVLAVEIFRKIDKNRNEMVEKSEWKSFRLNTLRKTSKHEKLKIKPCCKKLLKRCDRNADKKLNLIEWLQCFQLNMNTLKETKTESESRSKTKKQSIEIGESNAPKNGTKRFGPNPLKSFLKDDYDYVEEQ